MKSSGMRQDFSDEDTERLLTHEDPEVQKRIRDPEWLRRAAAFLDVYERVGPVEDNTWRLRRK